MLNFLTTRHLLTSLTLTSIASAQLYSPLTGAPSCPQSCTVLTQAATQCANAGSAANVATCFCTLSTTASFAYSQSICPGCTASDSQWFVSLCTNPATVVGTPGTTSTTTQAPVGPTAATSTIVGAGTTTTASEIGSATSTGFSGVPVATATGSWWQQHSRWVIMVIVLIIAFSIIIAVGVVWKRRYDKKRNTGDVLPLGSAWGPRQQHRGIPGELDYYQADYEKAQPSSLMRRQESGMIPLAGQQNQPWQGRTSSRAKAG